MGAEVLQVIQLVAGLIPTVVSTIDALIKAGHSPEEAAAIVKRDIESRRAEYEKARDADVAALDAKHGVPPNPFEEP